MAQPAEEAEAVRAQVARIRSLLGTGDAALQRMFGSTAVMVDGSIVVAVQRDGGLLARVDPADGAALLTLPGVSRMSMGGRTMGLGWLRVEPEAVADDAALQEWLDRARAYLATGAASRATR